MPVSVQVCERSLLTSRLSPPQLIISLCQIAAISSGCTNWAHLALKLLTLWHSVVYTEAVTIRLVADGQFVTFDYPGYQQYAVMFCHVNSIAAILVTSGYVTS